MSRSINYAGQFLYVILFVLASSFDEQLRMIYAVVLAVLAAGVAFQSKALSLEGFRSAWIAGAFVLGAGGWWMAAAFLSFFLTSSLLSRWRQSGFRDELSAERAGRDGDQVWANAAWVVLFAIPYFLVDYNVFLLAAMSAIAAANADTWATEIGTKNMQRTTYLITSFKRVAPGTDGGISVMGSFGALCGSLVISLISLMMFQSNHLEYFLIILIAGFTGSLVDSIAGAKLQYYRSLNQYRDMFTDQTQSVNNVVNLIGTGASAALVLIITTII